MSQSTPRRSWVSQNSTAAKLKEPIPACKLQSVLSLFAASRPEAYRLRRALKFLASLSPKSSITRYINIPDISDRNKLLTCVHLQLFVGKSGRLHPLTVSYRSTINNKRERERLGQLPSAVLTHRTTPRCVFSSPLDVGPSLVAH